MQRGRKFLREKPGPAERWGSTRPEDSQEPRRPDPLSWLACLRVSPAGSVQHAHQVHDMPKVSGPPSNTNRAPQALFTRIAPPDIPGNVQGRSHALQIHPGGCPSPSPTLPFPIQGQGHLLSPCNQLSQVTAMLTMPSHVRTQALPQSKAKTKDKTKQKFTKGLSRNQIVKERIKTLPWRTLLRGPLAVPCTFAPAAGPRAYLSPQRGLQMPQGLDPHAQPPLDSTWVSASFPNSLIISSINFCPQ